MNWYLEVLKKYAVFEGRARRKEYWFFILFNILISMALGFIDRLTGNIDPETGIWVYLKRHLCIGSYDSRNGGIC